MSKSAFVRSLQPETLALSPYHISQKLRLAHGCVSIYRGDPELVAALVRAYMIRFEGPEVGSSEEPIIYQCVVSLGQSPAWQSLAWTKEIIHILDRPEHRTGNKEALGHMLDNRDTSTEHSENTPYNVRADKDGFTLALGCTVPQGYRHILRTDKYIERFTPAQLEEIIPVPSEYIPQLLDPQFEGQFEKALLACDKT